MNLYRKIDLELSKWNNSINRKPLLLLGARQVGKTYSVKNFATKYFTNKYVYINFMLNAEYKQILNNKTDPKEIIETISIYLKKEITKDWLIILDEIQEIPNVRTSFKLFNEHYNEYHIIGLGSYLGSELHNDKEGFPVGKVDILHMYPLDFEEYLQCINQKLLFDNIANKKNKNHIHSMMNEELKNYLVLGGMPEVISTFLQTNDVYQATKIKDDIYKGYYFDITKYLLGNTNKLKATTIFEQIITFLMKENKVFILSNIEKDARYREYEQSLMSLVKANLIMKINNLNNNSSTLVINQKESSFKLFYADLGFISLQTNTNKTLLWSETANNTIAFTKGAIGENYLVLQLVSKMNHNNICFYTFNDSGRKYEIDLMIEDIHMNIIPVEVKLREKFTIKSLEKYISTFKPKYAIIFSLNRFNVTLHNNGITKMLWIPLYMVPTLKFEINRLLIDDLLI